MNSLIREVCGTMPESYDGIISSTFAILLTYFLVRIFGKALVDKMVDKETMNKVEERHTRAEVLLFFCLLIPGIPKDVFNFVAPYCKVPMWKYIVITLIARFPTVFSSILMGAAILNGEFNLSLVVLIVSATIGICGIIFKMFLNSLAMAGATIILSVVIDQFLSSTEKK